MSECVTPVIVSLSTTLTGDTLPGDMTVGGELQIILVFLNVIPPMKFLLAATCSGCFIVDNDTYHSGVAIGEI